jgi:adhesin transport system membrane fusion protein
MSAAPAPAASTPAPAARRAGVPSAISADLLAPPSRRLDALLLSLVGLVGVFLLWATLARMEEVTTGSGRVVPASKLQLVQNLEGGILREILVREGQSVSEGETILRIDPTQAGSSAGEVREKIDGLKALIARLEAEVAGTPLVFSEDIERRRPDMVRHQRAVYGSRQSELEQSLAALDKQRAQRAQEIVETEARIGTLKRALALAEEELALMRPLAASKAASRTEMLAIEGKVNDTAGSLSAAELSLPRLKSARDEAESRLGERTSAFRSEALQQLSNARVELGALSETIKGSDDRVSRTTIKAPVSGIVKTVHVSTPGQVVQPGHNLVEIVPMNDTLVVEAQVQPKDIAFLRPGQKALVKLTAYDFSVYGGLEGEVEHIGADSITNDRGETFYLIRVRTGRSTLERNGEVLQIIPGMVADVDVLTGSKTVLAYLTKPLTRMRQTAMRER